MNLEKLQNYLKSLGNHKLETLEDGKMWAIIRKSKQYSFNISFYELKELGFEPSHMQDYNGKQELIIVLK